MQPNTDANIALGQQRCIECPDGSVSDGTAANGACTQCSTLTATPNANIAKTQCVANGKCLTTEAIGNAIF